MKQVILIAVVALMGLIAKPLAAEEIDTREHVEVVGSAELKVVPNEFVVRATVNSFDRGLKQASSDNASKVAAIFKELRRLGIDRKYIVTDEVGVNAVTEGYRPQGNFRHLGYNVSRNVMVVLHEATQVEPAMKVLFENGVDHLSMSTGRTDIADLLENAEIQAAGDATKKANRLSSALGRRVGKAVSIAPAAQPTNAAQNFVYTSSTPDLGDELSLGKMRVSASVRVKFLLQ